MAEATQTEETRLHIEIDAEVKGGRISFYHAGQSLVLFQRLLNAAIEQDFGLPAEAPTLPRRQLFRIFQLEITEASSGSVRLIAQLNQQFLQEMLPLAGNIATNVFSSFVVDFIKNVKLVRGGDIQVSPDDPALRYMRDMAENASAGKLKILLMHGEAACVIDRRLYEKLKQMHREERRGHDITEVGTVVGSDMDKRRMDIYLSVYGQEVECYYPSHEASKYERHSRLGTEVEISGTPVWGGGDERYGRPNHIDLRTIRSVPRNK